MERHSAAGGIMKVNRTRTQKLLAAVKRGRERRKLSAEEQALVEAMRQRVEAEDVGPEMVDVVPEEQWLEQTITELHARPHLWPMLQDAMKKPNHRPNEEPHLMKEAVRLMFDNLVATKKNRLGMTGNVAMQALADRFGVPFSKIKNIIHPPKSRKRTP